MNLYSKFTIDRRDISKINVVIDWSYNGYRKFFLKRNDVLERLNISNINDSISADIEDKIIIEDNEYISIGYVISLTYKVNDHNAFKIRRWLLDDILPSIYVFPWGTANNL